MSYLSNISKFKTEFNGLKVVLIQCSGLPPGKCESYLKLEYAHPLKIKEIVESLKKNVNLEFYIQKNNDWRLWVVAYKLEELEKIKGLSQSL